MFDLASKASIIDEAIPYFGLMAFTMEIRGFDKNAPLSLSDRCTVPTSCTDGSVRLMYRKLQVAFLYIILNIINATQLGVEDACPFMMRIPAPGKLRDLPAAMRTVRCVVAAKDEQAAVSAAEEDMTWGTTEVISDTDFEKYGIGEEEARRPRRVAAAEQTPARRQESFTPVSGSQQGRSSAASGGGQRNATARHQERRREERSREPSGVVTLSPVEHLACGTAVHGAAPLKAARIFVTYTYDSTASVQERAAQKTAEAAVSSVLSEEKNARGEAGENGRLVMATRRAHAAKKARDLMRVEREELLAEAKAFGMTAEDLAPFECTEETLEAALADCLAEVEELSDHRSGGSSVGEGEEAATESSSSCSDRSSTNEEEDEEDCIDDKSRPWSFRRPRKLAADGREDLIELSTQDHLDEIARIERDLSIVTDVLKGLPKTNREVEMSGGRRQHDPKSVIELLRAKRQVQAQKKYFLDKLAAEKSVRSAIEDGAPVPASSGAYEPYSGTGSEIPVACTFYFANCSTIVEGDLLHGLVKVHKMQAETRPGSLLCDSLREKNISSLCGGSEGSRISERLEMARENNGSAQNQAVTILSVLDTLSAGAGSGRGDALRRQKASDKKPSRGMSRSMATAKQRELQKRAQKQEGEFAAGSLGLPDLLTIASHYCDWDEATKARITNMHPTDLAALMYNGGELDPTVIFSVPNALRHRDGLGAPAQNLARFRATRGRTLHPGGIGARDARGYGYLRIAGRATEVPIMHVRSDFFNCVEVPKIVSTRPPAVVLRFSSADECLALGVDETTRAAVLRRALATNEADRVAGTDKDFLTRRSLSMLSTEPLAGEASENQSDCDIVMVARRLKEAIERVCVAMRSNGLSLRAQEVVRIGLRRWAASVMAERFDPAIPDNSPSLQLVSNALLRGELSKLAPPVRPRLTVDDSGEECRRGLNEISDFMAAICLDLNTVCFQSQPHIIQNMFLCSATAFDFGLAIRNNFLLKGQAGVGKSVMLQQMLDMCIQPEALPSGTMVTLFLKFREMSDRAMTASPRILAGMIMVMEEVEADLLTNKHEGGDGDSNFKNFLSEEKQVRMICRLDPQSGERYAEILVGHTRVFICMTTNNDRPLGGPMADRVAELNVHANNTMAGENLSTHVARQDLYAKDPLVRMRRDRMFLSGRYQQAFLVNFFLLRLSGALEPTSTVIATIVLRGVSEQLIAIGRKGIRTRFRTCITSLAVIYAALREFIAGWQRPGAPYEGQAMTMERITELIGHRSLVVGVEEVVKALGFYMTVSSSVAHDETCAGAVLNVISRLRDAYSKFSTLESTSASYGSAASGIAKKALAAHRKAQANGDSRSRNKRGAAASTIAFGSAARNSAGLEGDHVDDDGPAARYQAETSHTAYISESAREEISRANIIYGMVSSVCPLDRKHMPPRTPEDRNSVAKIQACYNTDYFVFDVPGATKEEVIRFIASILERAAADRTASGDTSVLMDIPGGFGLEPRKRELQPSRLPSVQSMTRFYKNLLNAGDCIGPVYILADDPERPFTVANGGAQTQAPIALDLGRNGFAIRICFVLHALSEESFVSDALQNFLHCSAQPSMLVPWRAGQRGTEILLPIGENYPPGSRSRSDYDPNAAGTRRPCILPDVFTDYANDVDSELLERRRRRDLERSRAQSEYDERLLFAKRAKLEKTFGSNGSVSDTETFSGDEEDVALGGDFDMDSDLTYDANKARQARLDEDLRAEEDSFCVEELANEKETLDRVAEAMRSKLIIVDSEEPEDRYTRAFKAALSDGIARNQGVFSVKAGASVGSPSSSTCSPIHVYDDDGDVVPSDQIRMEDKEATTKGRMLRIDSFPALVKSLRHSNSPTTFEPITEQDVTIASDRITRWLHEPTDSPPSHFPEYTSIFSDPPKAAAVGEPLGLEAPQAAARSATDILGRRDVRLRTFLGKGRQPVRLCDEKSADSGELPVGIWRSMAGTDFAGFMRDINDTESGDRIARVARRERMSDQRRAADPEDMKVDYPADFNRVAEERERTAFEHRHALRESRNEGSRGGFATVPNSPYDERSTSGYSSSNAGDSQPVTFRGVLDDDDNSETVSFNANSSPVLHGRSSAGSTAGSSYSTTTPPQRKSFAFGDALGYTGGQNSSSSAVKRAHLLTRKRASEATMRSEASIAKKAKSKQRKRAQHKRTQRELLRRSSSQSSSSQSASSQESLDELMPMHDTASLPSAYYDDEESLSFDML